MYTLYYSPFTCAMAPHIVLEEIGQPYRTELAPFALDSKTESITNAEYLAINPKGRVPALRIENRILTEAPAILMYLARSHPEAGLLPSDPEAEARCYEWLAWLSTSVHTMALGQLVRPQRFVHHARDFPAVVAKGQENVLAAWAFIEQQLQGRDWAIPEQYSVADAYLLFFYLVAQRSGPPMQERYPAWSRVAENAMARTTVRNVIQQETMTAA